MDAGQLKLLSQELTYERQWLDILPTRPVVTMEFAPTPLLNQAHSELKVSDAFDSAHPIHIRLSGHLCSTTDDSDASAPALGYGDVEHGDYGDVGTVHDARMLQASGRHCREGEKRLDLW